jgi:hypothetical protein
MLQRWFGHHEFWHPRVFEAPFYVYLFWQCLKRKVSLTGLAKANYELNHGEIGLGSKYATQQKFEQRFFPATEYLPEGLDQNQKVSKIRSFAEQYGFPVILKPDIGMVGKGLVKISSHDQIPDRLPKANEAYLLQKFCDYPLEFGVFYVRTNGVSRITGINQKHYPSVTGDGRQTVDQLAHQHPRYNEHWQSFLQYLDLERVPANNETVELSFIGSHTLGCLFTDDSHLVSDKLSSAVFSVCDPIQGFNYGRLDVKAESVEDFVNGKFVVIEINGVSSLPTHMYDPNYTLFDSYRHFFAHARDLALSAHEQRAQPMELMPLLDVARHIRYAKSSLENLHNGHNAVLSDSKT